MAILVMFLVYHAVAMLATCFVEPHFSLRRESFPNFAPA